VHTRRIRNSAGGIDINNHLFYGLSMEVIVSYVVETTNHSLLLMFNDLIDVLEAQYVPFFLPCCFQPFHGANDWIFLFDAFLDEVPDVLYGIKIRGVARPFQAVDFPALISGGAIAGNVCGSAI
jgi:hypothetical protein